ncbi:hypothetical protein O181_107958 [Austropuccinia psidii MF-1]|uniref:Uncharacterized protein n=1 Tax=Austropuccinia psidii MF-1 TaxID=1389203 RepID=A0A9Q3JTG5_9BASI|nr:hypothetical protein [Austropuccinia psidii MF-1]
MPPTQLTILTLAECPPDTAYHPYACVVPSQHAPNTTYDPYACVVPSRNASDTAYHPYTCRVPSGHAPDTTYPITSIVYGGFFVYTTNTIAKIC